MWTSHLSFQVVIVARLWKIVRLPFSQTKWKFLATFFIVNVAVLGIGVIFVVVCQIAVSLAQPERVLFVFFAKTERIFSCQQKTREVFFEYFTFFAVEIREASYLHVCVYGTGLSASVEEDIAVITHMKEFIQKTMLKVIKYNFKIFFIIG